MSYVIVIWLLLIGAFLRLTDLATLPQGFSDDEIINIRLVDNIRQGDIYVFFPGDDGGREGMYHLFVAFVTTFVGEGTVGYRILSVWLGVLSIAIIYTLGNHLFNPIVGVLAAGLVSVNMSAILLSRAVSSDATVLFLVSATMLALARSLPVYRRTRVVTSNIVSFAALGGLLGIGFYLHPSSLFIVLGAMFYIAHLVFVRNVLFRQRRSYTGFAILLMLIISMPYVISSINLPQYSAGQRILSHYTGGLLRSITDGFVAIIHAGDLDPLHNLPGRALVDVFSGIFMLAGIIICVLRRHRPRFMLILLMFLLALPAAFIVEDSPNFARMIVILPQLAIFFGMGFYSLIRLSIFADVVFRRLAVAAVLALLVINLIWTAQDLFVDWRDNEAVVPLVNAELGQIAHFLDVVGDDRPIVFCNANWRAAQPERLDRTDKTLLMMNRSDFEYHEADCARSLLLTNGGARQYIVFFDEETREAVHPYLQEWLAQAEPALGKLPRGGIVELETEQLLADGAGAFTTTAPVTYAPEVNEPDPTAPPIRFGGNLTFLGYEPNVQREYVPGDTVDVITFWRAEGELLPDLTLKTHILSSPVTPIAIHDTILVNPALMHGRDVFIQITDVSLPLNALPGERTVSVGAYRQDDLSRLPVLDGEELRGDRIFLYTINVLSAPDGQQSGG
ncbi:MAG: glycosyltransferase family 39 protein [Chloroflexi bacterium]|nr:glycosyltransferase family 39 protein [Chloroflexota bacterium]